MRNITAMWSNSSGLPKIRDMITKDFIFKFLNEYTCPLPVILESAKSPKCCKSSVNVDRFYNFK